MVLFAVDAVHALNNHEDNPSDDEKFNNVLDEVAVGDDSCVAGTEEVGDSP